MLHTWAGLVPWIWGSDGIHTLLLQRIFVLMVSLIKGFCRPLCEGLHIPLHENLGTILRHWSCFQLSKLHALIFTVRCCLQRANEGVIWGHRDPTGARCVALPSPITPLLWDVQWFPIGMTSGVAEQGFEHSTFQMAS